MPFKTTILVFFIVGLTTHLTANINDFLNSIEVEDSSIIDNKASLDDTFKSVTDYQQAINSHLLKVSQRDFKGAFALGSLYSKSYLLSGGQIIPANPQKSIYYHQLAYDNGFILGAFALGSLYFNQGSYSVAYDYFLELVTTSRPIQPSIKLNATIYASLINIHLQQDKNINLLIDTLSHFEQHNNASHIQLLLAYLYQAKEVNDVVNTNVRKGLNNRLNNKANYYLNKACTNRRISSYVSTVCFSDLHIQRSRDNFKTTITNTIQCPIKKD